MRARLELAALALAVVAIAAFLISFGLGIGRTSADGPVATESLPGDDGRAVVPAAIGRVEVLNASRRTGAARAVTDRLRAGGFDVVYFGNAPVTTNDSSVVIDRVGRPDIARAAATRLGIARVMTQIDTTLYLEATIILGADWTASGNQADDAGTAAAERTWRERLRW